MPTQDAEIVYALWKENRPYRNVPYASIGVSSQKDTASQATKHSPDTNLLSSTTAGMHKALSFQTQRPAFTC